MEKKIKGRALVYIGAEAVKFFFPPRRDSFREENGTVAARDRLRRRSRVLLKTKCVKGFPVQRDANRVKGFLEIIIYIYIHKFIISKRI